MSHSPPPSPPSLWGGADLSKHHPSLSPSLSLSWCSDPYVRVSLVGGEHAGASVKKTGVIKRVSFSCWNLLSLQIHCTHTHTLPVLVAFSGLGPSAGLGECLVALLLQHFSVSNVALLLSLPPSFLSPDAGPSVGRATGAMGEAVSLCEECRLTSDLSLRSKVTTSV